jgi:hypothetical protein
VQGEGWRVIATPPSICSLHFSRYHKGFGERVSGFGVWGVGCGVRGVGLRVSGALQDAGLTVLTPGSQDLVGRLVASSLLQSHVILTVYDSFVQRSGPKSTTAFINIDRTIMKIRYRSIFAVRLRCD